MLTWPASIRRKVHWRPTSHVGTVRNDVFLTKNTLAGVAELADALDSGSSEVTLVEVRILSPAL